MQLASVTAALRRAGPHVAVWLFLVLIVAFSPLQSLWHRADFALLGGPLHLGDGLDLDRGLSVVDLEVGANSSPLGLRSHEVALMDAINAAAGVSAVPPKGNAPAGSCAASAVHVGNLSQQGSATRTKPDAVVFDVAFLKANSTLVPQCTQPIVEELHAAQLAGIKIYGVVDIENPNAGGSITGGLQLDPDYELNHDASIYAQFTGTGHSEFAADPDRPQTPVIYYPKVVIMPPSAGGKSGGTSPCAIPIVAVGQAEDQCLPLLGGGQQDENVNVIVPLGKSAAFERVRLPYTDAIRKPSVLDGQIVLVGDEKIDYSPGDPRSKFEMLAWATSQSIATLHARPYPRVLVDVTVMLALAVGGCALALGAFATVFFVRRGKALRLPLATVAGLAVPGLALYAVEATLLAHDQIFSQLTFPVLAILITVGVSLWTAISAIRRDLFVLSLQDRTAAVAERYDVFISYARPPENAAWVEEHVLGPLSRAKMPDGKPLRVFFDRQSIKVGFGWYTTIVEAIYGSRFFLPVYSEGYFDRPFCREEMDIAFLRQVEMGTFVLPVARVVTGIPERYARTQFVDVARYPDFMDDIIRIITGAQPPEVSVEKTHDGVSDPRDARNADGADRGSTVP